MSHLLRCLYQANEKSRTQKIFCKEPKGFFVYAVMGWTDLRPWLAVPRYPLWSSAPPAPRSLSPWIRPEQRTSNDGSTWTWSRACEKDFRRNEGFGRGPDPADVAAATSQLPYACHPIGGLGLELALNWPWFTLRSTLGDHGGGPALSVEAPALLTRQKLSLKLYP
jgi:hypothetical protein